jgi:hypothetical protein
VCQAYDKPNAPPRVTDTKTGDGAYCSLFAFLAGCVTDAGAAATGTGQRRPGLTEDLVWLCSLVDVAAGRLVASGSFCRMSLLLHALVCKSATPTICARGSSALQDKATEWSVIGGTVFNPFLCRIFVTTN